MREYQSQSHEQLMARYQRRLDAAAFDEIVSRFLAPALAVARQLTSDAALAEDAVQEAFLRVVRGRALYQAGRPFSSWFYAILRNVCTDLLRSRSRYAKLLEGAALLTREAAAHEPDAADALELLDDLPKDDRDVLMLRIVHDMPFRDVAAALGISEEAAKKRGQRALRRLRERVGAQESAVA